VERELKGQMKVQKNFLEKASGSIFERFFEIK